MVGSFFSAFWNDFLIAFSDLVYASACDKHRALILKKVSKSWYTVDYWSTCVLLQFFEMKNSTYKMFYWIYFLFFKNITKWKIVFVTFVSYILHFQFTKENKSSWDRVYKLLITGGAVVDWYIRDAKDNKKCCHIYSPESTYLMHRLIK